MKKFPESIIRVPDMVRFCLVQGLRMIIFAVIVVVIVLVHGVNAVELDSESKPLTEEITPKKVPVSVRESIISQYPAADIILPPPDLTEVLKEDEKQTDMKGSKRIGIFRQLPETVYVSSRQSSKGNWTTVSEDRYVWTLTVQSEGAKAIRIHIEAIHIPEGAEFMVYNTNDPKESIGPYNKKYMTARTDYWTESIFAPKVTLELYVPSGAVDKEVSFHIKEITHVYADLSNLMIPKVGTCHNDVTCYSTWSTEANGVSGIGTIGVAGVLWCTGSLLADFDADTWEDYYITANHCLSDSTSVLGTQADANTMEFYWFYQTSTCDGAAPNPATVPRTGGGADLISVATANNGNDRAFLRIRNETPGGVTYLGWTTGSPGSSDTLTGIHHPDGSFKRISFGALDGSSTNYWDVEWSDGVTEPGSSGSPLFDKNKRFIGQLMGGDSSCSNQTGIDSYGRFNITYPNIQRWLEIGGTISVNGSYNGEELGTPTKPYNTVGEANNFAWNGSRIKIQAGSYPETLTFSKELTLLATGGMVTIGQ